MTAYLRHPAVAGDLLVLATDDDLWLAPLAGGRAHRLTDGASTASHPVPSPDATALAFTLRDEQHPEAWVMPLEGGPAERLSHLGGLATATRAWHPDGGVVVATDHGCPPRDSQLVRVGPTPGHHRPLGWGSAHEVALQPVGGDPGGPVRVLIGRHTTNQGRWKRYRGGTAGQLWLDRDGSGAFTRLLPDLRADIASPMLVGDRIWFLADPAGVANLHSCDLQGGDLQVHSDHRDFYARFAATDGRTIVYACGGDLYAVDPAAGSGPRRIDLTVASARRRRGRTFAEPARWLQSYAVHPAGTSVALRVRGRAFTMPLHDGPATQVGLRQGANHRLLRWLHDGRRLVLLADGDGEERLEVHGPDGLERRLDDLDLGVPLDLAASPVADVVAVTDQQGRLRVVDLASGAVREVASCPFGIDAPAFSPDGRWLAFSQRESNWYTASIRLWPVDGEPGEVVAVTDGSAAHRAPDWDPRGRFLYWIAGTRFDPVADGIYFDHGFPHPDAVVALVLAEDGRSPLDRDPAAPGQPPGGRGARGGDGGGAAADRAGPGDDGDPGRDGDGDGDDDGAGAGRSDGGPGSGHRRGRPPEVRIDLDGIRDRAVVLPFPGGRYQAVAGLHDKVMAVARPLRPAPLPGSDAPADARPPGQIEVLSLDTGRHEVVVPAVTSAALSADRRTLVYAVKRRLRAVKAGAKPPEGPQAEGAGRASGWIDLSRIAVEVDPPAEWRQLFGEAWRLQRDLFWHADMSGVDWDAVRTRYESLVDRISTRAELSDLIWEMFGELGTGHAYERGGDHPAPPQMPLGHLGADLELSDDGRWVITRVLQGDPLAPGRGAPLRAPGVRVGEGAVVLAVDGVAVDAATPPAALLVNRAGVDVRLTVADPDERTVVVRTLRSERQLRYDDWVARNRQRVRTASAGRVDYVHVPDMGAAGYAAFHRQYLSAVYAEALVVDVRFNGGGNVSSLLLEKLASRRIGYQLRRSGALEPFPHHAPAGPLVAITNERCGSDGDIFTHAWKRLELGPVVGTRTWGGVIGIQPRHAGVDGTVTTQPAFAFWFDDVGWAVENHGTDPTHPVDIAPHDAAAGSDPQLDRAVELALEALASQGPPPLPDIGTAPDLRHPHRRA